MESRKERERGEREWMRQGDIERLRAWERDGELERAGGRERGRCRVEERVRAGE